MTYLKLAAHGYKPHLMSPDQLENGATLCGCVVTQAPGWRRISSLEGDECEKCAEVAFDASRGGEGER
jgi:hypothetical protein